MSGVKLLLVLGISVVLFPLLASADTAPPVPPAVGAITLVGTITEHYVIKTGSVDRETWYISLASVRRQGREFGYGIMSCFFVSTKSSIRECIGTYSLPRGKIAVAGSFLYPRLYQLSVTGGTGVYLGSGGVLSVREFNKKPSSNWIVFQLKGA
jgi:hypothetical protein